MVAKKKTSKTKKTKVVEKVPVQTPDPPPPVDVVESVCPPPPSDSSDEHEFLNFSSEIESIRSVVKEQINVFRNLVKDLDQMEKMLNKDSKVARKKMSGRKQKLLPNGEKPLNGFSKPGNVSDELREFLGLSSDELIARVDVTKATTKYCNENKLTNMDDKRILLPDKKLSKLLRIDSSTKEDLTYFNLQKYLKIHFPNKEGVYISL